MLYYVSHDYGNAYRRFEQAKKVTHNLQVNDTENCYLCPVIAFFHLRSGELPFKEEMGLRLDLLQQCDRLIIAGKPCVERQIELNLAKKLHMEVYRLEDDGTMQPFKE